MRHPVLAAWIGLAGLILPAASAAEPIEGRWRMGGGIVELRPSDDGFASHWVRQRPTIDCPKLDDKDGDMRLEGSGSRYSGTWRWVLKRGDGSCKSAGRGPMQVVLSADRSTATLEANAPRGYSDHETHTLKRVPPQAPAALEGLSQRELAAFPELVHPVQLSVDLELLELAAVPRLQQLPFQGREPFVR